ncbi:hypothetical protein STIUS_v1c04290 [Spiroplasma sp. TIUS-1]|uniref:hypothetical protein n=1 Tax=Spiroplasma sp. TIUS-1 TaxID=216963 RepID=UPI00139891EC|nr:hypothetical protein [Spiroplasma sp. TIUS-1]QHX35983.1 hypothetical protein STIUS_v1c04290 [Spiroplasma sp. TIUS-1]
MEELLLKGDAEYLWSTRHGVKPSVKCEATNCKFPQDTIKKANYGNKTDKHWIIERIKGAKNNNRENIRAIHYGCKSI